MDIVVDTNVFLNVKNKEEPYYTSSRDVLDSIDDGENRAMLSTVVLAEICAGYYLTGERKGKEDFLFHVLSSNNYKIVDVNVRIADEAARIRSQTNLRLPDAIIVATGTTANAEYIITNDLDSFKKAAKFIKALSPREFLAKLRRRH